ncbi:hypothetical protein RGQ29_020230 [Quercus rubra]|uniref:Cupin type-1 domain-containing protein n=1 Tax=Quercus rubra TaxID=3512 RepID=A0AAN7FBZ1_QUERU|nr:hypothetical protein RGQ29_020230 [Quercus rubra]
MMKGVSFLVTVAILALASSIASAYDPSPLQDFCVAINDIKSGEFVNGKFCKDHAMVSANDFFFFGINITRSIGNKVGSNVTLVNVDKLAGLNTLGISLARLDFAPYGLNPPHTHPRGTELLVVIEGETAALAFTGLSSQNPGVITIANAVFGSVPPINPNVLIKAFQLDNNVVEYLQRAFTPN